MDTQRLGTGHLVAAIAAVLLFLVMFLSWYSISAEDVLGDALDIDASEIPSAEELEDLQDRQEEIADDTEELEDQFGASKFSDLENEDDSVGFSAWSAFSFIDIILFLTILVAIAMAAMKAMGRDNDLPMPPSLITLGAGGLATLLVLYRVLDVPVPLAGRTIWLFLGLILTAAIAVGGWLAMQEEGASFDDARNAGGRPAGGPPPPGGAPGGGAPAAPPTGGQAPPPPGGAQPPPPSGPPPGQ